VALLGIEELVVESHTFRIFWAGLQGWRTRSQHAWALTRLRRFQAKLEATGEKVRQHFFEHLVKEGHPVDGAQQRAVALQVALVYSQDE
jgi:hypothetical protein